jgi:hypothetical protein
MPATNFNLWGGGGHCKDRQGIDLTDIDGRLTSGIERGPAVKESSKFRSGLPPEAQDVFVIGVVDETGRTAPESVGADRGIAALRPFGVIPINPNVKPVLSLQRLLTDPVLSASGDVDLKRIAQEGSIGSADGKIMPQLSLSETCRAWVAHRLRT